MFLDSSFYSDPEFAALPRAQRDRVSLLVNILAQHQAGDSVTKAGGLLSRLQRAAGCSRGNAVRMYYAYRESGNWRDLCDKRTLAPVRLSNEGTRSLRFREWVRKMMESNQRSTQAAIAAIHDAIRYGYEVIPGLEDWPLASGRLPSGCSETALRKLVKRHELAAVRFGLKSAEARAHDPMVLKTRVGVPVGSVYELDDVWHDHLVVSGKQSVRVLEFGAIDYASAARVHWGNTPHELKDDGSGRKQGLTQEMFVLFVAYLLRYVGFAASGVALHMERGTASLPERVITQLESCGLGIRVVRGRATGATQAKLGGFKGSMGGNPRAKSLIEGSHSLIHNTLASLPGQVGKDRQNTQEGTIARAEAQDLVERWRGELQEARPDLAAGLQSHLMTHHQFNDFLIVAYHLINNRTDHELEGWAPFTEAAVELAPGLWRPLSELDMTPLLRDQIACGGVATKELRMSPWKVWKTRRPEWATIPMSLYLDIIAGTKLCNRKLTVRSEMFVVQDKFVGQDKLYYDAHAIAPNGSPLCLREGESYSCIFNPYAPQALLVADAQGRVIAEAPQLTRVRADAHEELQAERQRVQQRKMMNLNRQAINWEEETNSTKARLAHNRAIAVEGGLVKPLPAPKVKALPKAKKGQPRSAAALAALDLAAPVTTRKRARLSD